MGKFVLNHNLLKLISWGEGSEATGAHAIKSVSAHVGGLALVKNSSAGLRLKTISQDFGNAE